MVGPEIQAAIVGGLSVAVKSAVNWKLTRSQQKCNHLCISNVDLREQSQPLASVYWSHIINLIKSQFKMEAWGRILIFFSGGQDAAQARRTRGGGTEEASVGCAVATDATE